MNQNKLNIITNALEEKKIENIEVIDVSSRSPFFTHVVIGTMRNSKQGNACKEEIQKNLSLINEDVRNVEGRDTAWVLIDCHDIIVHLFEEAERQRINLEALYTKGTK